MELTLIRPTNREEAPEAPQLWQGLYSRKIGPEGAAFRERNSGVRATIHRASDGQFNVGLPGECRRVATRREGIEIIEREAVGLFFGEVA